MRASLVLIAGLLMAPTAFASGPSEPASAALLRAWHPRAWRLPASPVAAGMRAAIDPVTGELTMPAADDPVFAGARAPRGTFLLETRADGSRRVLLNGAIRAYSIARIDAEGGLSLDCAHSARDVRALLAAPAPAPTAPRER